LEVQAAIADPDCVRATSYGMRVYVDGRCVWATGCRPTIHFGVRARYLRELNELSKVAAAAAASLQAKMAALVRQQTELLRQIPARRIAAVAGAAHQELARREDLLRQMHSTQREFEAANAQLQGITDLLAELIAERARDQVLHPSSVGQRTRFWSRMVSDVPQGIRCHGSGPDRRCCDKVVQDVWLYRPCNHLYCEECHHRANAQHPGTCPHCHKPTVCIFTGEQAVQAQAQHQVVQQG